MPQPAAVSRVRGVPLIAPREAAAVLAARAALPLRLGGEPQAGKARKRFRLVEADSDDGLIGRQIGAPGLVAVEARPFDAVLFAPRPAGFAPVRALAVPLHERLVLRVGDGRLGDLVGP